MIVKYSHLILLINAISIGRQSYPATSRRVSVVHGESAECSKHDMAWCQRCQWCQWFMENGWKWDIVTQTLVNCHITNYGKSPFYMMGKSTISMGHVQWYFVCLPGRVLLPTPSHVDGNHWDQLKPLWHMHV
jgi:hypothetical protein